MTRRRSLRIDISAATFFRGLGLIVLVWLWLRLWQWVLVFVVAVFLAIGLDPLVRVLEKHRLKRAYGAPLVVLLIVSVLGTFFYASGASLAQEARTLGGRLSEVQQSVTSRVPAEIREAASQLGSPETIGQTGTNLARALVAGLIGIGVALIVTVYLLLDGRRTYEWFVAFAPARLRPKVHETSESARQVIAAYIRGNLITSTLAAGVTWIALAAMQVPAALLLALLAGVLDLIPVIGFFLSAAPAVLLGLTVSPAVGAGVAVFYVVYNLVENYYIQPKVYGRELRLSDLAVIGAFFVGAELGGVLGAIIALPIAALYPVVERLWLKNPEGVQLSDEHRHIGQQPEH